MSSRVSASADVRRIDAAIRKLDQAQQVAAARGADLLAVAAALGAAAVEKYQAQLIAKLVDRELLRDIAALKDAFAAAPVRSLPGEFERLRRVPDAVIQWLTDSLNLSPSPEQGEMEVPAAKLARFSCGFPPPKDTDQLVRVRVTCRGWNRNGKSLIPARVDLRS